MPHVIVKAWPGKTKRQKQQLADAIAQNVMDILGYGADSVSVAVEDVAPDRWKDDVYVPDILGRPDTIFKKPGYEM
ncbi:MAG TPA: tautomerase family protein [Paraburkholderia sp.]|uniref:tautomerase family protein n=1 Tax=Paraburkholderia sp. TaxID=1926495 RepID=UPI002B46312B|nr:tautomerase family protein [Paraburkholderia sp.]HKR43653.1 tautomerase family protein [Paraburkholderia sp.]